MSRAEDRHFSYLAELAAFAEMRATVDFSEWSYGVELTEPEPDPSGPERAA